MNETYDKIIIGAGAAGLMAAYSSCIGNKGSADSQRILLLERKDVVGKKITATGNGKCNYTNSVQNKECYRSSEPDKAFRIIKSYDHEHIIKMFQCLGVLPRERNGYFYPYGEQAKSIRDVLKNAVVNKGAVIRTEKYVTDIDRSNDKYTVTCADRTKYTAKKIIIAAGGCAAPVFGTDGSIFCILKKLGLKIINPRPALCGLKTDYRYLKNIDGVRLKCKCSLYSKNIKNIIFSEEGEIIFSKNGISGIPVMNLSRFAVNEMDKNNKCGLILDLFPDMDELQLEGILALTATANGGPVSTALSAVVNDKLLKILIRESGMDTEEHADRFDKVKRKEVFGKLAKLLKNFTVSITGDTGFENAQTTQGGVDLNEINEETMECKKIPGMYLAGEVLDVDGMCGGYNLQWAWSTGFISGRNSL
ncbi:MAG: aminoacetone oxidase family FAD-binding enzyme [Lachnospiraceae bacterium]|nr:aminoacetone oxidase family FAD-binding enzyme [Lachnospiraceae bacterium]